MSAGSSEIDVERPAPRGAVFLSYASQDAEAVRRIAEALRAAGVEVWFDQNELVGGDAWDAKIRGQIASCALFLPIVSAATQARHEGYFRLEWKLAAQRTHMMSERTAFLLPVVIDSTRDAEADVPGEFKAVQWTRLPGGEKLPDLVARVKGLLRAGRAAAPPPIPAVVAAPAPARPRSEVTVKSVAVLAFANLSSDRDNEYFSDGISEELLNVLAKVPHLNVTARTSAFHFKGKDTPIPEIARQLGVAYVVEGSVRKMGNRVRITAQLINAADGFHLWSENFDRELQDIFAVQDEIAGLIAQNLQLKLGETGARAALDPAVYELLLEARALTVRESKQDWHQAIALYRRVLEREPTLALAWAEMARTYVQLGRFGAMAISDGMREARSAAQRSLELEPDQATGLVALGWVQRTADWDWRGARRSFKRAMELAPGDASIMSDLAVLYFNIGRVDEAVKLARQAVERDPLNARAQANLGFIFNLSGEWQQALAPLAQAVALAPAIEEVRSFIARSWAMLGRTNEAAAAAEQEPNEAYRLAALSYLGRQAEQAAASDRAFAEFISKYGEEMPGYVAVIYALRDEVEPAFVWSERAVSRRDAGIAWMKTNVYIRSMHADPRWPALLRRVGLADDQLK